MNLENSHWIYNGDVPSDCIGFIYVINRKNPTPKFYIGKKLMISNRKKSLRKGHNNRQHKIVETDWKIYCGSSPKLNEDIVKYGEKNFTFEILAFYPSKLLLAYHETKEIIDRNAIFSDEYYNEVLNCRFRNKK